MNGDEWGWIISSPYPFILHWFQWLIQKIPKGGRQICDFPKPWGGGGSCRVWCMPNGYLNIYITHDMNPPSQFGKITDLVPLPFLGSYGCATGQVHFTVHFNYYSLNCPSQTKWFGGSGPIGADCHNVQGNQGEVGAKYKLHYSTTHFDIRFTKMT